MNQVKKTSRRNCERHKLNEQELKQMIEEYLDNGDFTVSDYAQTEFAGITAMMAERWPSERLENLGFEYGDFDSLSDYAHEKAKAEDLIPGHDYR